MDEVIVNGEDHRDRILESLQGVRFVIRAEQFVVATNDLYY